MGSVIKWRKKKMSKHQHKKLLKKTRWQRTHK
ncbi:MAG: 30S ribosomal protein bS22 [Dehalococcoidia bacterium]